MKLKKSSIRMIKQKEKINRSNIWIKILPNCLLVQLVRVIRVFISIYLLRVELFLKRKVKSIINLLNFSPKKMVC